MLYLCFCFVMTRRPPRATRTDTLVPYTTLFRSASALAAAIGKGRIQTRFLTVAGSNGRKLSPRSAFRAHCGSAMSARPTPIRSNSPAVMRRSDEHTSELQSLMRNSYAVFCLTKKKQHAHKTNLLSVEHTYH